MASAKDLRVDPISPPDAHKFVRTHHYSGKSVNNSQLHLGIFLEGGCVGVMQFGPPMDKRKLIGLVRDTPWNGFFELNRMVLVDDTPKNTESRALAVAMRLIRRNASHIQWIVSFADATQCGDGTIYRAAGFVLTSIKKNTQIWAAPGGGEDRPFDAMSLAAQGAKGRQREKRRANQVISRLVATDTRRPGRGRLLRTISRTTREKGGHIQETGAASMRPFREAGFRPLEGFQLRYVYFLDPTARERLTVPIIPNARIAEVGARMYKGKRQKDSSEPPGHRPGEGGAAPTLALQHYEL